MVIKHVNGKLPIHGGLTGEIMYVNLLKEWHSLEHVQCGFCLGGFRCRASESSPLLTFFILIGVT